MHQLLEKIIPKLSKTLAYNYLTDDVMRHFIMDFPYTTVKKMFSYVHSEVKDEIIDEMLYLAVSKNDVEYFTDILKMHNSKWKCMANGESILTALIKDNKMTFCNLILQSKCASELVQLCNANNSSPLMVAIESKCDDLVDDLIIDTKFVDCENNAGDTALSLIFQRMSTGNKVNIVMRILIGYLNSGKC